VLFLAVFRIAFDGSMVAQFSPLAAASRSSPGRLLSNRNRLIRKALIWRQPRRRLSEFLGPAQLLDRRSRLATDWRLSARAPVEARNRRRLVGVFRGQCYA